MTKTICMIMLTMAASIGSKLPAQVSTNDAPIPRTGFTLSISVEKPEAKVGQIGPVIVKEKNVTNHLIGQGSNLLNICLVYRMEVLRDGVQVPKTKEMQRQENPRPGSDIGGSYAPAPEIKPGDEQELEVPVSECYDMTVPGRYDITFIWESDPNDSQKNVLTKSNTITLTVLPADEPPPAKQ